MKNVGFSLKASLIFFAVFSMGCVIGIYSSKFFKNTEEANESMQFLGDMYSAYNKKELEKYCSFFDADINVFQEQGLGNTRIISGKDQFRAYYDSVFRNKKTIKITPLHFFSVHPWIMVKELIEIDDKAFEAAVGYRLDSGKIRDRMILSENFLVNKEKLSIELPKQKTTETVLRAAYPQVEESSNKNSK